MTIKLTREEAQSVLDALEKISMGGHPDWADDVIPLLRARLSAPEPEPLEYWNAVEGWVKLDEVRQHFDSVGCGTIYKKPGEGRQPLYPIPPQREWQGLTDEECDEIWDECLGVFDCLKMTEAKLKEKNT